MPDHPAAVTVLDDAPAPDATTPLAPRTKHCRSCQCAPDDSDSLTVYPPVESLYGRCDTCGVIRWGTEIYTNHRGRPHRSVHCGCCTHPHDLANGGHDIPTRGGGDD
jgi:hypothetical protein